MRVGFIGAGKMAEAIIASLKMQHSGEQNSIFACDIDAERRKYIKKQYGINVYSRNLQVVENSDVIFLAVKPQQFDEILKEIAPEVSSRHLIISIAAGKKISLMESLLSGARVIRVMPNLATLVGEGMSVFCAGSNVTATNKRNAVSLLSCFGKVLEMAEEKFDAVTAVSGSGPAFFSHILAEMVDAGVKEGLDRADALLLAEQTMLGTSRLLIDKNLDPHELIKLVTSAKGTTAAGLEQLATKELSDILHKTIKAAARRSRELSR